MSLSRVFPDRSLESSLAQQWGRVVGMDEVGRGALAGPVCVGAAVVGATMPPPPEGLADSKMLSARKRSELAPQIESWVLASAVGSASAAEIDKFGLTVALRMAGRRALEQVGEVGVVLLDGSHDWLSSNDLFDERPLETPVVTAVKADMTATVVAAASVLAKVYRDALMSALPDPGYDWAKNKGYGSVSHRRALAVMGPSAHHRTTWKLI